MDLNELRKRFKEQKAQRQSDVASSNDDQKVSEAREEILSCGDSVSNTSGILSEPLSYDTLVADCAEGVAFIDKGDLHNAAAFFKPLVENGNHEAMFYMGKIFYLGQKRMNKAIEWYERASEHGNYKAMINLGVMYRDGDGIIQNYDKAFELFSKACVLSEHPRSLFNLAELYLYGHGTDIDEDKSIDLLEKSAKQDYVPAISLLASYYMYKENYESSYKYCLIGANMGDATCQYNLACLYDKGKGVSANRTEAAGWYKKAAANGHIAARVNYAFALYNGNGVKQNYQEALSQFKKSAEAGHSWAQFMLGICYSEGTGAPQNWRKSVSWITKAAESGLPVAQNHLGTMYENGDGVDRNYSKAYDWYMKAAEQKYPNALRNLGRMYENGLRVQKDISKARTYYRKALSAGCEEVKQDLMRIGN